jgi:ABC-type uncharacterized transport system ATPase subunit
MSNSIIEFFGKDLSFIEMKGVSLIEKTNGTLKVIVDSNIINISEVLEKYSQKFLIDDINIDLESIDSVIAKMYKEYKI